MRHGGVAIANNEPDNSLLIRAQELWRACRDAPDDAEQAAGALLDECGPPDVEARVVALRTVGWIQRIRFDHDEALATLARALRIARRAQLSERRAELLITRAGVLLEVGQFTSAARDLAEARRLQARPSAELENQQGVLLAQRGDIVGAAAQFAASLKVAHPQRDTVARFMAANNLAMALTQMGRGRQAVSVLEREEGTAQRVGRFAHGSMIQSMAVALAGAGRLTDALRAFDRARGLLDRSGWAVGESYLERVQVFAGLRLMREADRAAEQAIKHLAGAGGAMLRADTRLAQARVFSASGRHEDADHAASDALALYRSQRRGGNASAAFVAVARARVAAGSPPADMHAKLSRAARRLESAGRVDEAVDARLALADMARADGRRAVEKASLERVIALTQRGPILLRLRGVVAASRLATQPRDRRTIARRGLIELGRFRATLPTAELRALASGHGRELAWQGLQAAITEGRPQAVLEWMELGRMASSLVEAPLPVDDIVDGAMAQLRELQVSSASASAQDLEGLRREMARLEARIERRVRVLSPVGARIGRPPSFSALSAALGRDRTLVSLAEHNGRLVACVLGGSCRFVDVADAAEVAQLADGVTGGLRRMLRARNASSVAAARQRVDSVLVRLRDVFGPLWAGASGAVVVVPTGRLLAVPWRSLVEGEERAVSVAPSCGLWMRARAARRGSGRAVLVAGPQLDHAEREVAAIATRYAQSTVFHPGDTSIDAVVQACEGAAVAHLACHGQIRTDNPSFSHLRLGGGDLTLFDLERLRRPPDVLVLSACDVGAHRRLPGDELRGFVTAALTAGARSVVASCVPVHDQATSLLMTSMHEHLAQGASVGAALDAARRVVGDRSPQAQAAALAFGCLGDAEALVAGGS